MNDELYNRLKEFGKVRTNVLLSKQTTFRIGGPAKFLVEVVETDKLVAMLNYLSGDGVPYYMLGGGSNLLMPDDGFDGVVIKIATAKYVVEDDCIIAEAGVWLGTVLDIAVKNSLSGLEWAAGIPGTIGGAVRGNAGAMGRDMSNAVEKVEVWRDGEVVMLSKAECGFDYRVSGFKHNGGIVLRVWIRLKKAEKLAVTVEVKKYLDQRAGKFPSYPSAGCFFKNIKLNKWPGDTKDLPSLFVERGTVPVGWLIDQVGVKGLSVGGGAISDLHCNFVVNKKDATQAEILALVEEVKTRVYNKFGVELEAEVEIVRN